MFTLHGLARLHRAIESTKWKDDAWWTWKPSKICLFLSCWMTVFNRCRTTMHFVIVEETSHLLTLRVTLIGRLWDVCFSAEDVECAAFTNWCLLRETETQGHSYRLYRPGAFSSFSFASKCPRLSNDITAEIHGIGTWHLTLIAGRRSQMHNKTQKRRQVAYMRHPLYIHVIYVGDWKVSVLSWTIVNWGTHRDNTIPGQYAPSYSISNFSKPTSLIRR